MYAKHFTSIEATEKQELTQDVGVRLWKLGVSASVLAKKGRFYRLNLFILRFLIAGFV